MGFKDFMKKTAKKMKESQKPENVEKRLKAKIKQAELKNKLEEIEGERWKRKEQKYKNIKIGI